MHTTPILIIGSGGAGLTVALKLADQGIRSLVLSKAALTEGSTYYAQGGISAVLDAGDTLDSHVNDTLRAGAGLCSESAVRYTVENGPGAINWLIEQGVAFTRNDGEAIESGQFDYHLTQEGGHSHRRVIHVADATGRAVESALLARAKQSPFIQFLEHYNAIDLITTHKLGQAGPVRCVGAYVLNKKTEIVETIAAQAVVLACGGANSVYLYSSNPHTASGDGMAMAWRAGASLANMEFMQFHPTCLYHPDARTFLITEAVRGEGGQLKLRDGSRFMHRFDERAELAPRDIVARAIDHEMKRTGSDHVWLDISHQPAEFIQHHFPMIHAHCLNLGYDMTQQALPIVPAAHYTCGGIKTDLRARTTIFGLYAVGETACTGLHGANRMASNSLLECFVFGRSAAKDLVELLPELPLIENLPEWDDSRVTNSDEQVVVSHNWQEIRRFMWDYVGIVRTTKRLERALHRIELLQAEIAEYYGHFKITADLIELRNLAMTSELIIRSALQRRESRGLHYTSDYPYTLPIAMDTVLTPKEF